MSLYADISGDSVFAESTVLDDTIKLKDPKPFREAFVLQELGQRINPNKLQEYAKSEHAKTLIEADIISPDALNTLASGAYSDKSKELMVCHMAQEVGDDRFESLVALRAEERRLLDDMMRDYGEPAGKACGTYCSDFVNRYVPTEYQKP